MTGSDHPIQLMVIQFSRYILKLADVIIPTCSSDMYLINLRIIRPHLNFEFQNRRDDHLPLWITPTPWIKTRRIIRAWSMKSNLKTSSLVQYPSICPTWSFQPSDNPILKTFFSIQKTCSLSNATTHNPTCFSLGSDNPSPLKCLFDPLVRIIRPYWFFCCFCFLTWSWVERRFFLFFWVPWHVLSWSWASVHEI